MSACVPWHAACVAAILVGLSLVIAAPAAADEADCAPTYLANSGRELFEIDDVYLPPALRGFPADCASRISDEPFDDGTGISFAYVLLYTDVDFAEYTAILRAFERDGWIDASFPTEIDTDSTGLDESATIAELEALPQPPLLARSRFSGPSGLDLVAMTYSFAGDLDPSLTGPALTIEVLANQRFEHHPDRPTRACSAACAPCLRGRADARADRRDRRRRGASDARGRVAAPAC